MHALQPLKQMEGSVTNQKVFLGCRCYTTYTAFTLKTDQGA